MLGQFQRMDASGSFSNARLNMRFYLTALFCAIALASTANQASAQCGAFGPGYGAFGGYYNYGIQPYVPAPPYFALHPPVYYGQRYTRPYGDSPFAAASQLQPNPNYAPARHVERSLTITNPHILPMAPAIEAAPAPAPVNTVPASPVVVKPMVIDNPYFKPDMKLVDGQ